MSSLVSGTFQNLISSCHAGAELHGRFYMNALNPTLTVDCYELCKLVPCA